MSHEQQRSEVSQGLEHQQISAHTIASLRRLQAQSATAIPGLADIIDKLERSSQGLNTFFSHFLEPVIYNEKRPLDYCPSGSASAAQRVFGLPELLEEVLQCLDHADILRFHQVNQSARASIDASPRLQSNLSLRADATGSILRLPFEARNTLGPMAAGFICNVYDGLIQYRSIDPKKRPPPGHISLRLGFHTGQAQHAKIDTRCRSMYITQPPVKVVNVKLSCCREDGSRSEVRSATGITIGDLWDMRLKMREEHRLCPHAKLGMHDADGFVDLEPVFNAVVPVQDDHPMFEQDIARLNTRRQRQRHTQNPNDVARAAAQKDRIKAYIMYKQKAMLDSQPIMTLTETEKAGLLDGYLHIVTLRRQYQQQAQNTGNHLAVLTQQLQQYQNPAPNTTQPQPTAQAFMPHLAQAVAAHQQQNNAQAHQPVPHVATSLLQQGSYQPGAGFDWSDSDESSDYSDDEYN
ncbi:hypothetical protein LTR97_011497 [Elasticomyces elasticus]|uniref:F-box domain-containing protein n=1 Tax=Elasticomyces elasticus TaxID=574655 RepID=A0AAN7ZQY1_9PEZI|nr:hypothetical protein LTR97_011497 [Elasticomyces elasticus]